MNGKWQVRNFVSDVICLLYILLFLYAAVSKLLDFENFQVQIGQSPLLSVYASWMSWLVVFAEIFISILLIFPQWRRAGLWAGFNLMVMFTIYIFIILHYSSYVPCSCGGILEKMTWDMHLIFNFIFVLLGVIAIVVKQKNRGSKNSLFKYSEKVLMPVSIFSSAVLVVALYLNSERIMHYKNPFTRRYVKTSIQYVASKDLKFNSYYFAGYNGTAIYMGNTTAPLYILSIDTAFKKFSSFKIDFKDSEIPFRSVRINVRGKYFYLGDGSVPCLYRGEISTWRPTFGFKDVPRYATAVPIDSTSFVFRNNTGKNGSNIIGVYNASSNDNIKYAPSLLQTQSDGIFDTDGTLLYNEQLKRILYVYYYRNEFIIADQMAKMVRSGNTIDTTTKAKIKVAQIKGGSQRKMSAPPLMVNAKTSSHGRYLFVQSNIRGFYESDDIWKSAAVIDVYDLKKSSYVLSFPIFGLHYGKLKSFMVTETHLYALFGNTLMIFRLADVLEKDMNEMKKQ